MPVLADKHAIALDRLYRLPELAPEHVRHLVGYVQPPPVYVELLYPVGRYTDKEFARLCVGGVELGHILTGRKTLVF